MSSFWLKLAAVGVVLIGVLIGLSMFMGPEKTSEPTGKKAGYNKYTGTEKSFADVAKEDKAKLRAAPKVVEPKAEPVVEQPSAEVAVAEPNEVAGQEQQEVAVEAVEPEKPKIEWKPISEEDQIEAEQLLEVAIGHSTMARMGPIGLRTTVDSCRKVIQKWPGTEYEFRAKRILRNVPERFRKNYKITEEEIDLGGLE